MLAQERVGREGMLFYAEIRRLESRYRVARRALPSVKSFGELSAVRVRIVAISALAEGDALTEIAAAVA